MTLTDLQKMRVKIADLPVSENITLYGDGLAQVFQMAHQNTTTASAYVPVGGTAWSATACTFNTSGVVSFSGTISANSAFNVRYIHTTFSDDEAQNFLDEGGSVVGGALAAVESLMFDSLKRARWMAADGSQYDDTSAQSMLAKMHEILSAQVVAESSESGGFGSWALNQGDWS